MGHTNMRVNLVYVVLMAIVLLLFTSQSFADIDPATCMGAWLFDEEGVDTEDDISGNENHGSVKGNPNWDAGVFGQALDCDGIDDYVDCGDNDSLDVGVDDFSVMAWIKCANYEPGDWEAHVLYKFDHAIPRHGYLLSIRGSLDAGNKNRPFFLLGLGEDSGRHMFGTEPINDDAWHHLATTVERDGSMVLYRDGEVESQVNIAGAADQNEDNGISFSIGSQGDALARSLKSLIDEVAVFNLALTQDEVKSVMTDGLKRVLGGAAVFPAGKLTTTWAGIRTQR